MAKQAEDRRFIHRKWAELATAEQKRLSIQRLTMELMERFGGTKGVADLWHQACIEGTATRKLRAVEALIVMVGWLEDHPDILTAAAKLTDRELRDELQTERMRATAELIRDEPQVAAVVARELGFTLTRESGLVRPSATKISAIRPSATSIPSSDREG